jgi:hypothetical protein
MCTVLYCCHGLSTRWQLTKYINYWMRCESFRTDGWVCFQKAGIVGAQIWPKNNVDEYSNCGINESVSKADGIYEEWLWTGSYCFAQVAACFRWLSDVRVLCSRDPLSRRSACTVRAGEGRFCQAGTVTCTGASNKTDLTPLQSSLLCALSTSSH